MITSLSQRYPASLGDTGGDQSGSRFILSGGSAQGAIILYAKAAGGNWSSANTWSLTSSAGSDNSGPPDATQPYDVIFEAGSGNVTIDINASCRSLDCTSGTGNYTGTLTHASGVDLAIGHLTAGPGNVLLKFSSGMTYSPADITAKIILSSSVATQLSVTTAGKTLGALTGSGIGGSWLLTDTLTVTGFSIFSAGTFGTGNNTVNTQGITFSGGTVNLGASQVNLTRTSTGNVLTYTSGTINAGTSELRISQASTNTRTFAGGGQIYYDLTYNVSGSTGGLVVTGANTFHDIRFSDISNARTLTLPASAITTVTGSFLVSGLSGKLMSVISSSAGTAATLSKASGTVSGSYLSLKDSAATGGAAFYAGSTSTDVSGNSGWFFTDPSGASSYLLLVKAGA